MDVIDISSPRVGIVKLWVGEFLIFFMSVYNHYLTSHVSWGGRELSFFFFFFWGGGGGTRGYQNPYPMPALLPAMG